MLNKSLDNASVLKLRQLVASRYGKGLEIRQLMDLQGLDGAIAVMRGGDLHIPIRVEGNFLGTAVVLAAQDLNEEKRTDLTDMVRMILEPTMYNWYLERKESNLQQLAEAQFPIDNLKLFGEDAESLEALLEEAPETEALLQRTQLVSNLIHLEGKNLLMVKKIALQIHEMTHRWAFVPFSDIKDQVQSALDIAKMGAMTIFIEEIRSLSTRDQELLLEYLEAARSDDEPLIVSSSQSSIEELRLSDLHPHLLDDAEVNSFEVERAPMGYHLLKETLELLFLRDKNS